MLGIIKKARAILNNSLGIKGSNPAAIAFSKPIIELKYPMPQIKIIIVCNIFCAQSVSWPDRGLPWVGDIAHYKDTYLFV